MKNTSMGTVFTTDGTCALAPEATPRLTVLEGGLGRCGHQGRVGGEGEARPQGAPSPAAAALVFACLVAALFCALLFLRSAKDASRRAAFDSSVRTEQVVVKAGDTLWSIASARPQSQLSTDELVDWIEGANGLSDATLFAGQTLVVPVR